VKALKDKNTAMKKQVEESESVIADLRKKLRAAETEAKKAADAVKNNKDTKKLELTKKVLDEAKLKIGKLEELKAEFEKEIERNKKDMAEMQNNIKSLSVAAEEGEKLAQQCEEMKSELKAIRSENAEVID
jgi:DNA repair ATPase RecN